MLNEGESGDLATGASLNQIALAAAASVYGSLVDRYEGSITGYMNGDVHLAGWTSELSHELDANGVATTRATFPEAVPQINLLSFLDSNSRAAILKLVQPEK